MKISIEFFFRIRRNHATYYRTLLRDIVLLSCPVYLQGGQSPADFPTAVEQWSDPEHHLSLPQHSGLLRQEEEDVR